MLSISSTGIDTATTSGSLINLSSTNSIAATQVLGTFSGLTTGLGVSIVAAALTSGTVLKLTAPSVIGFATGLYLNCFDGTTSVLSVGINGHITSTQTTAPTIGYTGGTFSGAAITAGSTDVCGTITSTGTPASGATLVVTFNKTYTNAPKVVMISAATAAGGGINTMPIVTTTATFRLPMHRSL